MFKFNKRLISSLLSTAVFFLSNANGCSAMDPSNVDLDQPFQHNSGVLVNNPLENNNLENNNDVKICNTLLMPPSKYTPISTGDSSQTNNDSSLNLKVAAIVVGGVALSTIALMIGFNNLNHSEKLK